MTDDSSQAKISAKLDVLIALSLRQLLGDTDFSNKGKRKGAGDVVRYLSDMGLDPKAIANITGSPLTSVRTQLTPTRRK